MAKPTLKISDNLEDYLETILELEKANKVARSKEIAAKLGVMRGSVTGALKSLAEKNLINYEPYSFVTLTPKGKALAAEIARKHAIIKAFLRNVLLLDDERAEENACRMEHAMDRIAVERLVQFIEYIQYCPRAGEDWIQAFVNYYSKQEVDREDCRQCLESCVERFGQTTE
jgi:DtxR family Mn-dependent transcriptional regulator